MTSSNGHSINLAGGAYRADTPPSDDMMFTAAWVPPTADSSSLPTVIGGILHSTVFDNDVTASQLMIVTPGIPQGSPALSNPWIGTSIYEYRAGVSATQYQMSDGNIQDQYGVRYAASPISYPVSSTYLPPSPLDSLSSESFGVELLVQTASPEPSMADSTLAREPRRRRETLSPTPPPPYPAAQTTARVMAPVLTRVSKKPQQTQPGGRTIKYNFKKPRPDLEQRRTHRCDFPGRPYSLYQYTCSIVFLWISL